MSEVFGKPQHCDGQKPVIKTGSVALAVIPLSHPWRFLES